ncbi:ABC transporter ATP-binding protein [Bacillus sp. Marseille-P3661]|uniref:ABC transporter ATP-binding protein n=1 Tax=Bacillus sp. Marseille-P3661 TaxID=1936234 RepID=UPI000C821C1B|nr:ABC transporter ATP-binding protein [Bacillus sp. Marseille-P3661]
MNVVEVRNLSFAYSRAKAPIIKDFDFSMKQGEIVGILGPSGSGKSTLLRLIAGLELPSKGTIILSEKTVVDEKTFIQPENRGVGMVFQDYALFPHMTVKDNILFALHRFKRGERLAQLKEVLDLVHMSGYENRYPHELSGGQQQRIALARALAPKPIVLLMDEPFSNLDANLKAAIRSELQDILKKANISCLMVTHDQLDVEAICERSITM